VPRTLPEQPRQGAFEGHAPRAAGEALDPRRTPWASRSLLPRERSLPSRRGAPTAVPTLH